MRKHINTYYGQQQSLIEFWLQRTIPRLELLKELYNTLEDNLPRNQDDMKVLDEGLRHSVEVLDDLPKGILSGDSDQAHDSDPQFPPEALTNYVKGIQRQ